MRALLVLLIVFVAACAQQTITCPDGQIVTDSSLCETEPQEQVNQPDEPVVQPEEPETPPQPPTTQPEQEMDAELQALLEKHESRVKSVSFHYTPIEVTAAGIRKDQGDQYFVYDNLIKVERIRPQSIDKSTYADTIYLNTETNTAQGFCMNRRDCSTEGEEREAAYTNFIIKLPHEYIDDVPPTATMGDTINFQDRRAVVVRWSNGEYMEMYIDEFTGLPLHVATYESEEYADITGGVEFQEITYNMVKEEDVTP